VLDNFEHLLPAASVVKQLLEACPALVILVTSRAPLHLAGEHDLPVQPLALPEATEDLTALAETASVALFLERARHARPNFTLTAANAQAIASICRSLDGIPLAIELAAARIKILSAEQISERLTDRFRLLTCGDPDAPARHRTLRAALDWSFHLLAEPERALLRRISVFAGGASIEAVEHVCASDPMDSLAHLIDQSLVLVSEHAGAARYRLLETVRQYAQERLREAGEEPALRNQHAAWFLNLAEQAEPHLRDDEQITWLDCLDREYANLRSAIAWLEEQPSPEPALRLAAALWKFCEVRGHAAEGEQWLTTALSLPHSTTPAHSKALHGAANLAFIRGDYDHAAALHEQNLALLRQLGDTRGAAITLFHLASVIRNRGDAERSLELCRQSLQLFRELDDRRWCATALNSIGMALMDQQRFGAARPALDEALSLFRAVGNSRGVAIALGNLGDLDRYEADYDRADARLRTSLEGFHRLEDAWGSSATLESLALVAAARGSAERAAVLFGAAEAQRAEVGVILPPADTPVHDRALARLRLQLGAPALQAALARGRALSRSAAVAFVQHRAGVVPPRASHPRPSALALTDREREVAQLVARGLTNRQIADELVVTKHTADKHIANILSKLELASRAQLAVWWIAHAGHPLEAA
jgi:non-specific serine/threonine protein kinase